MIVKYLIIPLCLFILAGCADRKVDDIEYLTDSTKKEVTTEYHTFTKNELVSPEYKSGDINLAKEAGSNANNLAKIEQVTLESYTREEANTLETETSDKEIKDTESISRVSTNEVTSESLESFQGNEEVTNKNQNTLETQSSETSNVNKQQTTDIDKTQIEEGISKQDIESSITEVNTTTREVVTEVTSEVLDRVRETGLDETQEKSQIPISNIDSENDANDLWSIVLQTEPKIETYNYKGIRVQVVVKDNKAGWNLIDINSNKSDNFYVVKDGKLYYYNTDIEAKVFTTFSIFANDDANKSIEITDSKTGMVWNTGALSSIKIPKSEIERISSKFINLSK